MSLHGLTFRMALIETSRFSVCSCTEAPTNKVSVTGPFFGRFRPGRLIEPDA